MLASRRVALRTAVFLAVCLAVALLPSPADSASTLPEGFADARVTGIEAPTAIAFTPDWRMLVATQQGQLRVHQNGSLLATPALDLGSSVAPTLSAACWVWR